MNANLETYTTEKVTNVFITMVKIEMELSGKSFEEAKKQVKEYLKSNGLM